VISRLGEKRLRGHHQVNKCMIHISYLNQPFHRSKSLAERGSELLNNLERSRLLRYTRDEPKLQLVLSRWLIHEQLARSFPELSRCWRLTSDATGRPSATHPDFNTQIHYSLSHCVGLIACVISDDCSVGIDSEPKDQLIKDSFIDVGFTTFEQEKIRTSPFKSSDEMKLRWTIKESLGKMTGQVGFESIVSFCTEKISQLDAYMPVFLENYDAWICCLPISNGHFATLAVAQDRLTRPDIEIFDSSAWA
jgi:phosphopantetheinyl transferase